MANDFEKILGKIEEQNTSLRQAQARLLKAYERLDGKLTQLGARTRVDPYAIDKKSEVVIGYRRYENGFRISTVIAGLGGTEAEVPVTETAPERQALLMAHVAGLLEKVLANIAEDNKTASTAADTAEKIIEAVSG